MRRALFMTVGTGRRDEKSIKSLAHGLLVSITHYNPDRIVFFGSKDSTETIESVKRQYYENRGEELINYEFVTIAKIDDFDECFERIKDEISQREEYEIVIDYTSGTKTMTMSAAICSMLYHKNLSLVAGKRGVNGIVVSGTEKIVEQSLYLAYDKILFDKVKNLFNSYRFGEAKSVLNQIVILDEKEKYEQLINAYDLWDKFDHKEAFRILAEISISDRQISQNKGFLGRLNKVEKYETLILVDLINNASRRMEEGKYDDAVARLYRAIELISQIKLAEEGLNDLSEKKFTMDDLKGRKVDTSRYEKYADDKGRLKLGLENKFKLLKDLGWEEADTMYLENNELKTLLRKRNNSILAHGLEPVDKATAEDLFEKVRAYATIVLPELDDLMAEANFPIL
jgi:CRISPR-associated protein (TIGR02710 family)